MVPPSACGTVVHSAALPTPFPPLPTPFLAALHPLLAALGIFPPLATPFPRRFAPQARELWLVGGERSLLGKTIALEEYAGCSATGPPHPIVSHTPTDDHKKYGLSYLDMDTRAKFNCEGLCSVGVRMLAWSDENDLLGSAQVHPLRLFRKCQTAQSRQRKGQRWRLWASAGGSGRLCTSGMGRVGCGGGGGGGGLGLGLASFLQTRRSDPTANLIPPPPNHAGMRDPLAGKSRPRYVLENS